MRASARVPATARPPCRRSGLPSRRSARPPTSCDRIRTYNFPQGRLTDHRINLTLYKLLNIMEGDLGEVLDALQAAREAELLEELAINA